MIPDNIEKIIMTKDDYDRNVEQLLFDKIKAEMEVERLNNIINELEKWLIMFNETHKNDTGLYSNWLSPREILNKLNKLKEK